jgi:hypothetical protein
MGVTSQVLEDRRGATEGSFGIDDPLGPPGLGDQAREPRTLGQRFERSMEPKTSIVERLEEQSEKLASEQAAQNPNGQEEVGGRGDPLWRTARNPMVAPR